MGILMKHYLNGSMVYACGACLTHLSQSKDIVSKSFHGACGTAYLFSKVINVIDGPLEDRTFMTGVHTVCDIYCIQCSCVLGWKYIKAYQKDQEYKTGFFILEITLTTCLNQNNHLEHRLDPEEGIATSDENSIDYCNEDQDGSSEDASEERSRLVRLTSAGSLGLLLNLRD